MSRRISIAAAVSVAAVAAAVAVTLTYTYAMDAFNAKVADVNERQALYTKLSEIDRKTREDYVGAIDEKAVTDGICAGYLAGLGDPHAKYLTAKQYQAYRNSADSKSTGVGIRTIRDADGNMEVVEVVPGSPAEKAGIKKGDTILQVDGKDVVRVTYAEAVQQLDGAAGSRVAFRLLRAENAENGKAESAASSGVAVRAMDVTVTRGEYTLRTVVSSLVNGNVAYLKLSRFGENTAEDFNSAVSSLMRKGVCGLVVDLRGNSGGSVKAAAAVLDTLLPAGTTVQSRGRDGKTTAEYASGANEVELPVSVIIDGQTSGAAELFAADIRDFKKGLTVGNTTAGDGAKETAVPLSDGSAMVLPTAEYLTAGGGRIEGAGVTPDIQKSLSAGQQALLEKNDLAPSLDAQVQTAVTALARQGAKVKEPPGASPSGSVPESAKD